MSAESLKGGGDSHFAWLRRSGVALGLAGTVAGILRLKGGSTPPTRGGWRYLTTEELADQPTAAETDILLPRIGDFGVVASADVTPPHTEADID